METGGIFAHRTHTNGRHFRARPWSEIEDTTLAEGIGLGKSFGVIADEIGRSRNSCIGRANRLNLDSPKRPVMKRKPGPRRDRDRLEAFAEALANCGTVRGAAHSLGLSHQRGSQFMSVIRAELGWQAS